MLLTSITFFIFQSFCVQIFLFFLMGLFYKPGTDQLIDKLKKILIAFESTNYLIVRDNGRDRFNLRTILDHAIDVEYRHAFYNRSLSNIINHIAFRKFIEQVSILFERRGRSFSVFSHSHNGSFSCRHSLTFFFSSFFRLSFLHIFLVTLSPSCNRLYETTQRPRDKISRSRSFLERFFLRFRNILFCQTNANGKYVKQCCKRKSTKANASLEKYIRINFIKAIF